MKRKSTISESEIEAGIDAAPLTQRDTIIDILEAAEFVRIAEYEPIAYLREIDGGTANACWVICSKGDPGARPVYL